MANQFVIVEDARLGRMIPREFRVVDADSALVAFDLVEQNPSSYGVYGFVAVAAASRINICERCGHAQLLDGHCERFGAHWEDPWELPKVRVLSSE